MFEYGSNSKVKLDSCHPRMKEIAELALTLSPVDISIVHGLRDQEIQDSLVRAGFSKLAYPKSCHNHTKDPAQLNTPAQFQLSDAIDFAPYIPGVGIKWKDTPMFALIAGCMFAAAGILGYKIRWGGDWDMDGLTTDQSFMDWGHIELVWE